MLLLMAGLGATIAAKSASSLHQTVLLGATTSTSTSQNTCGAIEIYEEEKGDDNNNKLPPPPPPPKSDSVSAEPTNPTASASTCAWNEMHHAILPTLLQMSNAILRRQDHEHHLSLLQSQQQAHQSEMLKLQQSMDCTISSLQDQLNDLRNTVEKMQEEQQKKRSTSLREHLTSSSASLYNHLPVQLLDISHMRSEPQHAICLTVFLLLPTIVVVLHVLKILIKKGTSKHHKKRTTHHNGYNYNHHHPLSPTSASMGIPNLLTTDSCSSPSLGSMHSQSSPAPATPCPPYIAIPAVHRRMTTAMTIEQMARDADDQHPHSDHLPLPPPPLIPPLCHQEHNITVKTESYPDKTKSEHVLRRKARILSRRLRSMTRKMKKSPAIRFFLGMTSLAVLAMGLISMAPSNWRLNELSSLNEMAHPLRLVFELIITFSVFVAAGYRLSYCSSGTSNTNTACTPNNKRSTIRRHRSLIRGPSTVRSNTTTTTSSSSRSAVFRRQRRPSKRSLFARSRLE